ncbi:MAG: aldehyde dehydrogenase family protein, partial [Actinoallomurus sp.]
LDLTGAHHDLAPECEQAAADTLKRVLPPTTHDWTTDPSTVRMTTFLETKTVWHPVGI